MIDGDQMFPVVRKYESGFEYSVIWMNKIDFTLSSQSFLYGITVPSDASPYKRSGFLGTTKIPRFGTSDVYEAAFTKDGKYFLAGLGNGLIQIYDYFSLTLMNAIQLNVGYIIQVVMLDISAIILDNLWTTMFIIDLSNIINPIVSNFSFNSSCSSSISWRSSYLFEFYDSILYYGYNENICLYDFTNQTNTNPPLLNKYEIPAFVDLYWIYLHNTSIICLYHNGTANIFETKNLSKLKLIASQDFRKENSYINDIFWRPDGQILYVTRDVSLDYYKNNDLSFTLLNSFLHDQNTFGFSTSNDGQLLSYIRQNTSLWEYVLVDITAFTSNGQYIQLWSEIPDGQIPYSVAFHPNNNVLLLCQSAGMEMLRIILENFTNETPFFSPKRNLQFSHNYTNWWIEISPSQQTIYMMNQTNQIVSINVNSFGSDSFEFNNPSSFFIYPYNSSDSDEKIMIYKVENETNFEHQSDIYGVNISDYLVSSDQNFLYLVLSNNATLKVYNISEKKQPIPLTPIDLGIQGSAFLELSDNGNEIYVSTDKILFILNITNPKEIYLLNQTNTTKHNFSILAITKVAGDEYLIVSDKSTKNPQFIIYQVNSTDFSLKNIGITLTSSYIIGLQIFNTFYLLVVLTKEVILYSLYNILSPHKVVSYYLSSPSNRVKIGISSLTQSCYFPFGDIALSLYSKETNSLYSDSHLVPNSSKIEFQIDFLPLNLDPNTNIKVLKINTATTDSSKLVNIDLDKKIVQIYPNTIKDLVGLLQPLTVICSTNINKQELRSNEIETLIYSNYIDSNLFIKDYSSSVSLFNPSISQERIDYILSQHYFKRDYYFSIDNFIRNLVPPSKNILLSPSTQIGRTIFYVDSSIDFFLSSNTFINVYELTLTYTAQNLPPWLNFDSNSLRFHGKPDIEQKDKNYTVNIVASNGFQNTSDSFDINIRYYEPKLNIGLQQQIVNEPWAGTETNLFFNKFSFVDLNDNGTLEYTVKMINDEAMPSWIVFDDSRFSFKLNPTDDSSLNTYTINVTASNLHFSSWNQFSFYVYPSVKFILSLISEIVS